MSVYDSVMLGDNGVIAFVILVVVVILAELWNSRKYYMRRLHRFIFTRKMRAKDEIRFYRAVHKNKKLLKELLRFIE